MDRGAWQAIVHGVPKSQTQLSDEHFTFSPGDLPELGIKSVSPALAGRFSTPEPPGKPLYQMSPAPKTVNFSLNNLKPFHAPVFLLMMWSL